MNSGRSHFDTNVSDHHHFFFEDTGRLLDIPGEHIAVSGLPKPPAGAAIRRIDVIIRVDRDPAPAADSKFLTPGFRWAHSPRRHRLFRPS